MAEAMLPSTVLNKVSLISLAYTALNIGVSYLIAQYLGRKTSRVDKFVLLWLVWDLIIHVTVEGPFVVISLLGTVKDSSSFLALMWKEYGKADSRWLVSDPTIVSLEILTVFIVSPLCIALIYAIAKHRPYRHWFQLAVCVCELYGGWMTFAPEWLVGSPSLNTDNWLFLWVYLVFFNGLWVIVPAAMLYQSWDAMSAKESSGSLRTTSPHRSGDQPAGTANKKDSVRSNQRKANKQHDK